MPVRNRTPQIVMLALLAAVAAGALLFGGRDEKSESKDATAAVVRDVPVVARRVQDIRDLRFRRIPVPRVVDPDDVRRESVAELDRSYPERRRRADEEVVTLLGLVPPDFDLRKLEEEIATDQVAGYYDTRRRRLAVVRGTTGGDPVLAEVTLAHELVHALEDQRFGIDEPEPSNDDASSAYGALVEGSATAVMTDYAARFVPPGKALGAALAALGSGDADLPEYVLAQIDFTYGDGKRLVDELRRVGRGWKLVDFALRRRAPESSEQVLHPEKYLAFERAIPVRLRTGSVLGPGWRRGTGGALGEFDTGQMLQRGDARAATLAARGWGGGRYELWLDERQPAAGCRRPCRRRDALVLAWAWDSADDAREFGPAVRAYLERGLHGRRSGPRRWTVGDGSAALAKGRRTSVLAFAPTAEVADRLAARALVTRR